MAFGTLFCALAAACTTGPSVDSRRSDTIAVSEASTTIAVAPAPGALEDVNDGQVGGVDIGDGQIVGIPDGEVSIWIADSVTENDQDWSALVDAYPETGLWPIQLEFLIDASTGRPWSTGEVGPSEPVSTADVTDILTSWSSDGPVLDLADGVPGEATVPIGSASLQMGEASLALIPVSHPGDVVAALGWWGAVNYDQVPGDMSAVLLSWEDRFGAFVTRLGFDSMYISVTRPPGDNETARALAVEHFAWCPALSEFDIPLDGYATELVGATEWYCWWD